MKKIVAPQIDYIRRKGRLAMIAAVGVSLLVGRYETYSV
jgi:hypothetical protein